jgi:hypothetical protein
MPALTPTQRCWLPVAAGFALLIATLFVGLLLTWLMMLAGVGLVLDGITAMWARAGGTGNLARHRQ